MTSVDGRGRLRVRPHRLNTAIAALFIVGSVGFALGSTEAYASAVGVTADAVTFFLASIFFTSASFLQLVQSQSPEMAAGGRGHDDTRRAARLVAWLPHDRNWLAAVTQFPGTLFFNGTTFWAMTVATTSGEYDAVVWRPDFYGSILFLVSSAFAVLASGRFLSWQPRQAGWRIAWLNMVGSIAFMLSAIAAWVDPNTSVEIDPAVAASATFVGAVCFLVGAVLMIPAWRQASHDASTGRA